MAYLVIRDSLRQLCQLISRAYTPMGKKARFHHTPYGPIDDSVKRNPRLCRIVTEL